MRILNDTSLSVSAGHVRNLDDSVDRGNQVSTFLDGESYTGSLSLPQMPLGAAITIPAANIDNGNSAQEILSKPHAIEINVGLKGKFSPIDVTRSKNYKVK